MLASQELDGASGGELLGEVRQLHPHAKRALLIGWGEWGFRATGDAILEAIEHGRIDHYVVRPVAPPDELFHHAVSTIPARVGGGAAHRAVRDPGGGRSVVGPRRELRTVLERCAFPHAFAWPTRRRAELLGDSPADAELPVVILPDGTRL